MFNAGSRKILSKENELSWLIIAMAGYHGYVFSFTPSYPYTVPLLLAVEYS